MDLGTEEKSPSNQSEMQPFSNESGNSFPEEHIAEATEMAGHQHDPLDPTNLTNVGFREFLTKGVDPICYLIVKKIDPNKKFQKPRKAELKKLNGKMRQKSPQKPNFVNNAQM